MWAIGDREDRRDLGRGGDDRPVRFDQADVAASIRPPLFERRRIDRVEWIALGTALGPIVAIVVWAVVTRWMPQFDAGYFTVRSRDVLTRHHPLVGAWSSGSSRLDGQINNLGPLQLDLLAPFTKVSPYWGTAVGTAAINAAAVVGVWLTARRMSGAAGVVAAMGATVALELSIGSLLLIEPRQQFAMLLPFWLLLWLCAAVWSGWSVAFPAVAFTASLLIQTHLSYAYIVLALVSFSSIAWCVHRRPDRSSRRHLLIAAAIAVVVWIQPIVDQLFGTGNLLQALRRGDGGDSAVGYARGVRIIADATLDWPVWFPGTMGDYRPAVTSMTTGTAWLLIAAWTLLLVAVVVVGRRSARPSVAALGSVAIVVLLAAVLSASAIPPGIFGIQLLNYLWMWPIAVFATTAVVAGIFTAGPRFVTMSTGVVPVRVAGVAIVLVMGIVAIRPVGYVRDVADEAIDGADVSRPLLEQLDDSLAERDVDGPLLVDRSHHVWVSYTTYTMLAELQRHRIDFTFEPGTDDIRRFGDTRCETGAARQRIVMVTGKNASAPPVAGATLLASVDGMSPDDVTALAELDARFGAYVRDGAIAVDLATVGYLTDERVRARIEAVLADADAPATGLATEMLQLSWWGPVTVPRHLRHELARWQRLETRATKDRVGIYLAPIGDSIRQTCDD